jgi:hypothetical protein
MIMREMSMNNPHTKLTQRVRQVDMTSSKPVQVLYKWAHIGKATVHMAGRSKLQQIFLISSRVCPETDKCKSSNQRVWRWAHNKQWNLHPNTKYIYIYVYQSASYYRSITMHFSIKSSQETLTKNAT